jgi:hypothetical protein
MGFFVQFTFCRFPVFVMIVCDTFYNSGGISDKVIRRGNISNERKMEKNQEESKVDG